MGRPGRPGRPGTAETIVGVGGGAGGVDDGRPKLGYVRWSSGDGGGVVQYRERWTPEVRVLQCVLQYEMRQRHV